MTTTANDRRKEYAGNGVTTQFTGPRAFSASHVAVYLVDDATQVATLQTAYTITNVGVRNRQTIVTMTAAPASGTTLLILRTVPYEQDTDITNQGAYLPQVVEDALDKLEQQLQQVAEGVERSFRAPDTATGVDPIGNTPNRYVVTDSEGKPALADDPPTADLTMRTDLSDGDTDKGADLVAFKPEGTGTVSMTLRDLFSAMPLSVLMWIPVAEHAAIRDKTSTFDCTTYIQQAITDLGLAGGGTLFFPRGLYNITATLDVPFSNVALVGAGSGFYTADGIAATRNSAATRICWTGAAPATGTPMVEFRTPSTARTYGRGSIRDIMLDGNVTAKAGLVFTSYSHGRGDNVHVYACMEDGFLFRTANYALLAGAGACQFNNLYSCAVTAYGGSGVYLTNPCNGVRFIGSRYWHITPGQNGDSSHNTVYSPRFDLAKGTAITFESVGQNVIHAPQGGAWAGTTSGYDIIFGSTDQDSTYPPSAGVTHPNAGVARYNAVYYCEHAVVAKASVNTNGAGSFGNMVWGASRGNVAPEPWIETPVNNTKRPELTFHTLGTSPNGSDPSRTYLGGVVDIAGRDDSTTTLPVLSLIKNSDVGTAGDGLARIQWRMTNAAGTINVGAGHWDGSITNATAAGETCQLSFFPMFGGVETQKCVGFQNGLTVPDALAPTLSYQGFGTVNVSVGYYIDNVKVVGPRDTGWGAMTGTSNKATVYNTATVTLIQLAERVKALQEMLVTHGLTGV